ncbi:hypothetical protein DITRI_Ditri20bG0084300 [Diplodiscus trichospermus]
MAWQTVALALTIFDGKPIQVWKGIGRGLGRLHEFLTNNVIPAVDDTITEIQQKALDDIVNVNSLFTIAVFLGLAFTSPGQRSLENKPGCDADPGVAKRLITYEVVSFAFFLLSSLTAKTLKVQLHIHRFKINVSLMKYKVFRGFMLSLSFEASLLGILFLTLSMVNVIQIRLGKLSCGSLNAVRATAALCTVILIALTIYLPSTINVIWVLITTPDQTNSKTTTQAPCYVNISLFLWPVGMPPVMLSLPCWDLESYMLWCQIGRSEKESGRRRRLHEFFTNNEIPAVDDTITEIQQKALDDIVNVNSLFTIAVFVGLTFASPGQRSLENKPGCDADPGVAKRLVTYEVVSFAFFLLSSLTAKTLKVQLHIHRFKINVSLMKYKVFRGFMLSLSFGASLLGIVFLTLSMVNVIQIRLGKLSCGSLDAIRATAALCAIVLIALAIYLPSTINVIWVLITTPGQTNSKATTQV